MTDMSPEIASLIVWAAGVSNLIALGTTVWNIVSSGARTNAKTLEDHARRLDLVERQIELAKARLDGGPTPEHIRQIFIALTKLEGDMGMLAERLKPLAAITERLQEHALNQANGTL